MPNSPTNTTQTFIPPREEPSVRRLVSYMGHHKVKILNEFKKEAALALVVTALFFGAIELIKAEGQVHTSSQFAIIFILGNVASFLVHLTLYPKIQRVYQKLINESLEHQE